MANLKINFFFLRSKFFRNFSQNHVYNFIVATKAQKMLTIPSNINERKKEVSATHKNVPLNYFVAEEKKFSIFSPFSSPLTMLS